ncbi:MAG TPA: hypothetical protein VIH93_00095 [Thermoanaerobaculia bacterium]|jgi:hypothetical protein
MFTKTSRYYAIPDRAWCDPNGRRVAYKGIRLIARRQRPASAVTVVDPNERLDLVAARTLGRAELAWKLCDANQALDPFDLVEAAGRVLWIPEA